ncbi:MAG: sigma-E processing peptidase SpoIIGA [Bacillota bacterium]|nr:sigma-E processing peptidase SpoIIGA [Bacillota bacterium]
MKETIVYADLCFLINFSMDFVILWTTAKLGGISISYGRITIAALLGSIYAVGYLFYSSYWIYSIPGKIALSICLVFIALHPKTWNHLKKGFLYFYAVSFIVAGASIAASYLFNMNNKSTGFSYLCLLGGLFCAVFIASYAEQYLSNHLVPELLHYNIEFHFGDQSCSGEGFLDTGNGLRDPLSKRPVVVAEYDLLRKCLPQDFCWAIDNNNDENELLQALTICSWANRLRLIPFSSIGKKNGLMIGVRCDELVVKTGRREKIHKNLVVAVYRDKLTGKDKYQVLIPSEILLNA